MNSHQRRKERRRENRFMATPEGRQLVETLDNFEEFVARHRSPPINTGICFFCGVHMAARHDSDCPQAS